MDAFKIAIKIFVANDTFAPDAFVPVFHNWIQNHAIEDHLLIDVADYAHVPDGPGTVLISSEANFYMDRGQGRLGLMYSRKRPAPGDFRDRLRAAIAETFKAAAKLEQAPGFQGRLKFRTDEMVIRLNDRLLAPSTEKTFADVKPDVEAVAREVYGDAQMTIEPRLSPSTVFEVRLKTTQSGSVNQLLERIAQPA